ncbi:MAG TPA: gliding motility protein RemB, partial [Sphingobacterium sp.]|nr:gliding motility protein RemB [Sphingobacterium sp.]
NTIPNLYGNHIAQGIKNNIYYADAKAAYVLNPKYNLRLELGYTQRYAKAQYETPVVNKSGVVSFGLRSSFRAIYNDL